MATVTTSTTNLGKPIIWDIPPGAVVDHTNVPRGEALFDGSQSIPLKDAADVSVWNLTCPLPIGFVYRIVEFRLWALAPDASDFADWAAFMKGTVTPSPDPGHQGAQFFFQLTNQVGVSSAFTLFSYPISTGGAADNLTFFEPNVKIDPAISCLEGDGSIGVSWLDTSADDTGITVVHWRIRALVYDISQYNNSPVHVAMPVIGA